MIKAFTTEDTEITEKSFIKKKILFSAFSVCSVVKGFGLGGKRLSIGG